MSQSTVASIARHYAEAYPRPWSRSALRLTKQVFRVIHTSPQQAEIDLTGESHVALTPVLRLLSDAASMAATEIRFRFADQSVSAPFSLGAFRFHHLEEMKPQPDLVIGLASHRHPELDFLVDLYVVRTRELYSIRQMAAREQFVYQRTVALLDDDALNQGADILVVHTGLLPMVVGFYRGVATVLRKRSIDTAFRPLTVRPAVLRPDDPGGSSPLLTPKSFGAQINDYYILPAWSSYHVAGSASN